MTQRFAPDDAYLCATCRNARPPVPTSRLCASLTSPALPMSSRPPAREVSLYQPRKLSGHLSFRYALEIRPMPFSHDVATQRSSTNRCSGTICLRPVVGVSQGYQVANVSTYGPFCKSPLHLDRHCKWQPLCPKYSATRCSSSDFNSCMWLSITCVSFNDLPMEITLAEVPCRCIFRPSLRKFDATPTYFYTAFPLQYPEGGVASYKRSLQMTLNSHTNSGQDATKDPCTMLSSLLPTVAGRTNWNDIFKVLCRTLSSYTDESCLQKSFTEPVHHTTMNVCLQKSPADGIPLDMAAYSSLKTI